MFTISSQLKKAALDTLRPVKRSPGRPPKRTEGHVSVPPHCVLDVTEKIQLDQQTQVLLALYSLAYEENYGRPPYQEQLLRDLVCRGITSDENFLAWKRAKKEELEKEPAIAPTQLVKVSVG